MSTRPILLFDSGLGGLTFAAPIRTHRPQRRLVYIADRIAFPYGDWRASALRQRLIRLFATLIERHAPAVVVLACNTASTLALATLRRRFPGTVFVGTVPAIKPAVAATRSGLISVLATPGTIRRAYTTRLIADFAGSCHVTKVASRRLAGWAEAALRGMSIDEAVFADEIAPCFVQTGERATDTIVLGCTHYPLIQARLARVAPWPVTWVDSSHAVARRVADLVDEPESSEARAEPVPDCAELVDEPVDTATARVFADFGFTSAALRP